MQRSRSKCGYRLLDDVLRSVTGQFNSLVNNGKKSANSWVAADKTVEIDIVIISKKRVYGIQVNRLVLVCGLYAHSR